MRLMRICKNFFAHEQGSSLVETALVTPFLLLLAVGALDLGRAFYLANEIAGAAQAGAEYGMQNPTDTTGMRAAATSNAPDVPGLQVATPQYGCECSDGTSYSANCSSTPSCSTNVVYRVNVTVSDTYTPTFPWPGIPSSFHLSNTASMRSGGS
jgi:Flp pilus assembly protein TadG